MLERGVVLWDFEGTLAYRPGRWSVCLHECLVEVSESTVTLTVDDLRPHLRSGFPWHRHEEHHHHLAEPDVWWASLEAVFEKALTAAGVREETAQATAKLMRHRFTDPHKWTVFADTVDCLERVRSVGWRNVILSNHVPELERLVADLGLSHAIDAVYTSALVGWEKPHPQFFRHVLKELEMPAEVWMVGDNPIADVAGARAVGIPAVLVNPVDDAGPHLTDAVDTILKISR